LEHTLQQLTSLPATKKIEGAEWGPFAQGVAPSQGITEKAVLQKRQFPLESPQRRCAGVLVVFQCKCYQTGTRHATSPNGTSCVGKKEREKVQPPGPTRTLSTYVTKRTVETGATHALVRLATSTWTKVRSNTHVQHIVSSDGAVRQRGEFRSSNTLRPGRAQTRSTHRASVLVCESRPLVQRGQKVEGATIDGILFRLRGVPKINSREMEVKSNGETAISKGANTASAQKSPSCARAL